ncbi:MAG: extracellular solute-binding protein [Firmicutes bacterium]|nr:extracellular solute-binding protein [Bacillota bacterium]
MKKLFLTILSLTALVIISACTNDPDPVALPPTEQTGQATDNAQVMDDNGIDLPPATIRYANWNMGTEEENNIERRMIQAFMERYPHITVEIDESIPGDWMGNLAIAASTGSLPDVFMVSDTATKVINGWLLDITDISNADSEFTALPQNIRDSTTLGGRVYTVPFAQFLLGYFINADLFDTFNLDPPQFGFDVDEFISLINATTDLSRPTLGLTQSVSFADWMPAALNPNLGFFAYDGTGYAISSPEMIQTVNTAAQLNMTGTTWLGITPEQQAQFLGAEYDGAAFREGLVAFLWDGTWALGSLSEQTNFSLDFVGVPGGRTPMTLDITALSATTAYPEQAYLLAKWMGHGIDGYLTRLQIAEEMGIFFASVPVSPNPQVQNAFLASIDGLPGLRTAIENLDNAIIDGNKVVPGYVMARFNGETGIAIPAEDIDNATIGAVIHHASIGNLNLADHAAAIEAISRGHLAEAQNLLN